MKADGGDMPIVEANGSRPRLPPPKPGPLVIPRPASARAPPRVPKEA